MLSFESIDELDHVIFVYSATAAGDRSRARAIPGLHGRRPVFATPRALALSYVDPYVDFTGRVTGYAVVDCGVLGDYDWRLSEQNVWKVERMLLDYPHRPIRSSDARIDRLRARYVEHMRRTRQSQADLLPRPRSLDADAARVHATLTTVNATT